MTDLTRLYGDAAGLAGKLPPVETWHPAFCGDIDMHITDDGTWLYNGSAIGRPAMVQLFARILRKEGERYFLVTPVEKVGITVADAPFIAVEMTAPDGHLSFRTNVGDVIVADSDHGLRFDTGTGFRPYLHVRHGLEARLSRQLAQDLVGMAQDDGYGLFVRSGDAVFHLPAL